MCLLRNISPLLNSFLSQNNFIGYTDSLYNFKFIRLILLDSEIFFNLFQSKKTSEMVESEDDEEKEEEEEEEEEEQEQEEEEVNGYNFHIT